MAEVVRTDRIEPDFAKRRLAECADYNQWFVTRELLDRGTFGVIFAVDRRDKPAGTFDGVVKAVLITSPAEREEFEMERAVMVTCEDEDSPVVPYLNWANFCLAGRSTLGTEVYLGMLVMQRFDASYYAILNTVMNTMAPNAAQGMLQEMLDNGLGRLRRLHACGFAHLDAKHTNFLRKERNGVTTDVVADFGRTRKIENGYIENLKSEDDDKVAPVAFRPMVDFAYLLFSINAQARFRRVRNNRKTGRQDRFDRLRMPTERQDQEYLQTIVEVRERPRNFKWVGMTKDTLGGPTVWAEYATAAFELVSRDFFAEQ